MAKINLRKNGGQNGKRSSDKCDGKTANESGGKSGIRLREPPKFYKGSSKGKD